MAKTNILVVEDESIVSKDIQYSLKKLGYNVVGAAATGEKAVELAGETKPDLVLMDIMLKGEMSGIDAAEQIRSNYTIPVIYLTAYADEKTLAKAKVTEPYGYIIKPFKEIDVHTSIEMALYKHRKEYEIKKERDLLYSVVDNQSNSDIIFVKSQNRLVKVETRDIYYIEAVKDYVDLHTVDENYTIHSTMKEITDKLSGDEFVRVHRSYIVRIDKIKSMDKSSEVLLEDIEKTIPIGGSFKEDLQRKINTL